MLHCTNISIGGKKAKSSPHCEKKAKFRGESLLHRPFCPAIAHGAPISDGKIPSPEGSSQPISRFGTDGAKSRKS